MLNMPKSFDDDNGVDHGVDNGVDGTLNLTSFKYWLFLVSIVPSHASKVVQWFGSSTVYEVLLQMCIF